jgi:hypothetical protein
MTNMNESSLGWEEELFTGKYAQFVASEEPNTHNAYPYNIRPHIHEALIKSVGETIRTELQSERARAYQEGIQEGLRGKVFSKVTIDEEVNIPEELLQHIREGERARVVEEVLALIPDNYIMSYKGGMALPAMYSDDLKSSITNLKDQ